MPDHIVNDNQNKALPAKKSGSAGFDLRHVLHIISRRFRLILGVTLLATLFGVSFLSFQKTLYTATAMIQLNSQELSLLDIESALARHMEDSAAIQSQLDILKSKPLIRRVVEKQELYKKPEFNSDLQKKTLVSTMKKKIKGLLGADNAIQDLSPEDQEMIMLIKVTSAVSERLNLSKDPLSYTVRISFTSEHPTRAERIANAIADEYLLYQIDSDNQASRRANEWLSERVEQLRKEVQASEESVQAFVEKNNLFQLDGKTLNDQQASELNTALVLARTDHAQAAARLSRARQLLKSPDGIESVREVLESTLIQSLREQETQLLREKTELSSHFGPKHPSMERINEAVRNLRQKINSEINKIIQGMESEAAIASVRKRSLENQMDEIRQKTGQSSRLEVQLMELRRQSETNRVLYESFLTQLKQTKEAENLKQANAQFIARADRPLKPSYPNKTLILILFIMLGGLSGATIALLVEYLNRGFITPDQIEEYLEIFNLGMVPEIKGGKQTLADYTIERPNSIYVEALRMIMASLRFHNRHNPPKSILVTSALPQEGKGWLSTSMARIAAKSGKKVLLLDCDFHRPVLSNIFGAYPVHTLNDFLDRKITLKEVVNLDVDTGMHYIVSSPAEGNIENLLNSDRMKKLIESAHESYDLIIIDSPPVIGMSDVLFLSELVDTAILAVRWSKTPYHMAQKALRVLERAGIDVSGAALTCVPLKKFKEFEFGSLSTFKQYHGYYHEPARKSRVIPLMETANNVLRIATSNRS